MLLPNKAAGLVAEPFESKLEGERQETRGWFGSPVPAERRAGMFGL